MNFLRHGGSLRIRPVPLVLLILVALITPAAIPLAPAFAGDEQADTGDDPTDTGDDPVVAGGERTEEREECSRLTLMFPLLTGYYRSAPSDEVQVDGALAVPLLAAIGEIEAERFFASGYASPYLGVGSAGISAGDLSLERSGTTLLPWLPFVDDTLSVRLHGASSAECSGGSFAGTEWLTLPGLAVGLYDRRTCGIESDTSLFNIWDISLLRYGTDLRGSGFRPSMRECETPLDFAWVRAWSDLFPAVPEEGELPGAEGMLRGSRSGLPVDHIGILDPMIAWDRKGESLQACGIEPLFHYDADEGFSLPFLATCISGDGVVFGSPALRHLFPIVHGNAGGTRWDFLANYGTVHALDDYTAVDLKLLFNYQHRPGVGRAWGFLPFITGRYPGSEINPGVRFVHLDNHAVAWWNVRGEEGVDVLDPFLFSYRSNEERSKFSVGPLGFPFKSRWDEDSLRWRLLWVVGYGRDPKGSELDLLGIPLFRSSWW